MKRSHIRKSTHAGLHCGLAVLGFCVGNIVSSAYAVERIVMPPQMPMSKQNQSAIKNATKPKGIDGPDQAHIDGPDQTRNRSGSKGLIPAVRQSPSTPSTHAPLKPILDR
jgi:hypothetical protein